MCGEENKLNEYVVRCSVLSGRQIPIHHGEQNVKYAHKLLGDFLYKICDLKP